MIILAFVLLIIVFCVVIPVVTMSERSRIGVLAFVALAAIVWVLAIYFGALRIHPG